MHEGDLVVAKPEWKNFRFSIVLNGRTRLSNIIVDISVDTI